MTSRNESRRPRPQAVGLDTHALMCDDGGAESRPRVGDSARGPGVCKTRGAHPFTRRRLGSRTSAHATPASRRFRFPQSSKAIDRRVTLEQ